ncbi:glutathione S-transferase family protein [Brackiella oedipodis]|uniref:glutathione S-transferase family protein n=1 Tax=Brackiella oedipodis TaxID=124225 RepID=UPI0005702883|nr:glutathione S-transferase [Brackiella oedipodis]
MSAATIKVHYLENSRAQRIVWALEELKQNYEIVPYKRQEDGQAADELSNAHPLGVSPVLELDGQMLTESGAILNLLQRRFDTNNEFKPSDEEAFTNYDFWLQFAEGSFMPLLTFTTVTDMLDSDVVPMMMRPVTKKIREQIQSNYSTPRIRKIIAFVENYLGSHEYFSSDKFGFADIQMAFPLRALTLKKVATSPNILAYVERVTARPAFKATEEKTPDHASINIGKK